MYQQKKQRDYKNLWLISIALIAIGIVITIRLAMIRPLGFLLLGAGAFGLIWSLTNMDRWKDKDDRDEPRHFN